MIEYTYKRTQKGDYLIRDQADRQMTRVQTEPEAKQWITKQHARDAAEVAAVAERAARHEAFNTTVPDLNQLQIRWQNWRNWFYNEVRHAERHAGQFERALDLQFDQYHDSPSFQKQQSHLTEELTESAAAGELYNTIVALDTRMKNARHHHDETALTDALADAEPLIEKMNGFFIHKARPEEYKRPSGRPPAAGTQRQVRATITMPPEYKTWLEEHGDVSAQIRDMIERAMKA